MMRAASRWNRCASSASRFRWLISTWAFVHASRRFALEDAGVVILVGQHHGLFTRVGDGGAEKLPGQFRWGAAERAAAD